MKLKVEKFLKDRKESTLRSKSGELEVLKTDITRGRLDVMFREMHPDLAQKADSCPNKLTLGCRLRIGKRNRPECNVCL